MKLVFVISLSVACGSKASPPPPPPPKPPIATPVLSSPGPLSASHQKLDVAGACNECHVDGTEAIASVRCVNCHDHRDLGQQLASGRGFHASPQVKGKECQLCHREHKGRGFDLMGWQALNGGMTGFDHRLTGWPLDGKHATAACDRCHAAKNQQGLTTFIGTDRRCGACHSTQPHGFQDPKQAITRCERCHTIAAWAPAKSQLQFDHQDRRDAAFPLDADHRSVACAKCHPNGLFDLPATTFDCQGCHPKGLPKKAPRR